MNKVLSFFGWILAKRSRIILAILIVAALGLFFFNRKATVEVQIQTSTVERGTIVSAITASGTILTANISPITTSATGIVKKAYVEDGQEVAKGQTIAEIVLDETGAQKNASAYASYISSANSLNAAKNNLRSSTASLEKVYDDIKGHDSDETFAQKETRTKAEVAHDNAYDGLKSAEANLVAASLSFRTSSPIITAPSSGVITNITIVEGMTLSGTSTDTGSSSTRVGVLETKGTPLTSVNVSEIDVPRIAQGQKATITLDAISDKTFTGKVVSVDRLGTITSGVTNYPVIIQLDSEATEILPNMAANANIIIETKSDVLLVPTSAVKGEAGQNYVVVVKDGIQQNLFVEVGISSDTQTEILSGLSEGDIVVTSTISDTTQTGQFGSSPFGSFGGGARSISR